MTEEEIDTAISLLPEDSKRTFGLNYFERKYMPKEGKYYLSPQGSAMVERMYALNDPVILQAEEQVRSLR